jgi:hypothetical protein
MVKGVPPIGGRHELDTCDRYPQTRLLMRPGSKVEQQDRMGCADIEGASPGSAMGIKPRKTPHPSVDYSDVFHSSPHAWRRDAGNYTAFSGQLGQVRVPQSPSSGSLTDFSSSSSIASRVFLSPLLPSRSLTRR